jgi:hypothetical protein
MRRFRAILAQDGVETAEGPLTREFPAGCFTWEPSELPAIIRGMVEDEGGHFGAFPLGVAQQIERQGSWIVATGFLDDEGSGDDADRRRDTIGLIERGVLNRLSVDPGNGGVEVEESCDEVDDDDWCIAWRLTFRRYSIGGATVVAIPALQGTLIELLDDEVDETTAQEALDAIAASAMAVEPDEWAPPLEWFEDPELETLTRHPIVTGDGRVMGHVAGWQDCHINFADYCQTPWRSQAGYAYAHVSSPPHPDVPDEWRTPDGGWAGVLSCIAGHWTTDPNDPATRDWRAAQAHYDDPRAAVSYVRFGEDEHGIWFAGALRAGVDAEQVTMFRSHRLSGDWRRIEGSMEMIAGCSVNVPGFVRSFATAASAADDGTQELVAAVVAGGMARPAEAACCDACSSGGGTCAGAGSTTTQAFVTNVAGLDPEVEAMIRRMSVVLEPQYRAALRARLARRGA